MFNDDEEKIYFITKQVMKLQNTVGYGNTVTNIKIINITN